MIRPARRRRRHRRSAAVENLQPTAIHLEHRQVRRCDARRLVITGYGAVLSYLSDAPLVGSLLGEDPTSPTALEVEQEHILDLFRHALEP